jgi:hypothetical protein
MLRGGVEYLDERPVGGVEEVPGKADPDKKIGF